MKNLLSRILFLQFLIVANIFCQNFPLIPRENKAAFITSVTVPCVAKHFTLIPDLLQQYSHQTQIPDEVVISLSEIEKLNSAEVTAVELGSWPFQLKIIKHYGKVSEGHNRNIALDNSIGDIILCQDADDLPHPQRVEVVKYLFENYYVEHLMHTLINGDGQFAPYNSMKDIVAYTCDTYAQAVPGYAIHNGHPCFLREVGYKVRWSNDFRYGTDSEFNTNVYRSIKHKVVVHSPLVMYRRVYSSYDNK